MRWTTDPDGLTPSDGAVLHARYAALRSALRALEREMRAEHPQAAEGWLYADRSRQWADRLAVILAAHE